jgi:hypothetical protein
MFFRVLAYDWSLGREIEVYASNLHQFLLHKEIFYSKKGIRPLAEIGD